MNNTLSKIFLKFCCSSFIFIHLPSYAQSTEDYISKYQQQAQIQQLAQQTTWQRLLYIDPKTQHSRVSYQDFFIHPQGKQDASLELNSDIHALFTVASSEKQNFRCRFPARSQWLIEQLNIQPNELQAVACPEFEQWFDEIKPHKTTLVFATDFMGNPSSMFGHTLLRIDPKDQADLNLVSYAINYAATPDAQDGDFAYAWKGLTGKYPSEYSLMPYYRKVKEYGDLESRDLWEYELKLSPEQTQFLVKHIWELQHVRFPYYFISDNCAYALLGLFDLLDPELHLQQQFGFNTVPIESIKAVEDAGLVANIIYRPALETQLLSQVKQHGSRLAKVAHHVAYLNPEQIPTALAAYSDIEQAQILEMAYDDLYLALIGKKIDEKFAQPRIRFILGQRSRIDVAKQRQLPRQPKFNPLEGHHARQLGVGVGQIQQQDVLDIEYRQAYHDLADPQTGYRFGTQLVFLQGKAQLRQDHLKLEQLTLMSVNSFNPINPFKTPLSWGMAVGWQQESVLDGQFNPSQQHGVMNFNAQAGYSIGDSDQKNLCYGQLKGYLQVGKEIQDHWRAAPAPTFGCLNRWTEQIHSVVQVEVPYWLEQNQWNPRLNTQWQYAINPQNSLRINWQYQQQNHQDWNKWTIGYATFF